MLATSDGSCSGRLLGSLWRWDARVDFFTANFHFLFDDGLHDSIAEIGVFLFELGHLAIQVSENLVQVRHSFRLLEVYWVAGNAIFSRENWSVKDVVCWPLAMA
jgi:hypothetical protein